jgi:catechol 2,3-dioxygenase-like lactoylglutathione lyase family enzyme
MSASAGIHHVTAICGDPKRNVDFYTHNLGLRLVKKTVNFDDPSTWHLYYGDETGRPGTALTFFAWPGLPPGQNGNGMTLETAFIIPERSLGYWTQRLVERGIAHGVPQKRFGETVLPLSDPDGMRLALVAAKGADAVAGWSNGDVPAEHALRGFHGVTLMVGAGAPTADVLTAALGFKAAARRQPATLHRRRRQARRRRRRPDGGRLSRRPPRRRLRASCRLPRSRRRRPGGHGQAGQDARSSPHRPDRSLLFPLGLLSRAGRRVVRDRNR